MGSLRDALAELARAGYAFGARMRAIHTFEGAPRPAGESPDRRAKDAADAIARAALPHQIEALRFAAHMVRESGEAGTEAMAQYIESLIPDLTEMVR